MDVEVRLSTGETFTVTERILYDFGAEQRHGIFRLIPIRYGRGATPDFRIHLDVDSVTDERGASYGTKITREGSNLKIRIGDPDHTVTGRHEYRIIYRVRRGLLYFDDHDEIYWNATGIEWPVPIGHASARVILPPGTDASKAWFACYTGPFGSTLSECDARAGAGAVDITSRHALGIREGLTLVVGLPKGILREPSRAGRILDRVGDAVSPWMMFPLAALLGMLHVWRTRGRDPAGADAIPVRYGPPEGLCPAEVGTILDERADMTDLTATILDLAVRGHLTIEETETAKFLFFSTKDYRLTRKEGPNQPLKRFESKFIEALFESGNSILVSSLKNSFYRKLPDLRKALYESVSKEGGYFPASPDKVRGIYLGIGVVLAVAGFLLASKALGFVAGGCLFATGAIVAAFSPFMPRRTARGRQAYQEILGFREFVERVDAQRLERMGGRTVENFEKVLPFAIVLGAADQWADAFADIYRSPPRWYASSHPGSFSPRIFVSDVGSSLKTIGTTMASSPGGGSGSSGFSGGSSGGGSGGGGGGSW